MVDVTTFLNLFIFNKILTQFPLYGTLLKFCFIVLNLTENKVCVYLYIYSFQNIQSGFRLTSRQNTYLNKNKFTIHPSHNSYNTLALHNQ